MSYEIPQQLEYKEKIIFNLDFKQLAYVCAFGLLISIILKLTKYHITGLFISAILALTAVGFMFFNLNKQVRNWKSFLKFRYAFFMDNSMKKFLGINKVKNDSVEIKQNKDYKISIIKVTPINFTIKNIEEKNALIKNFQKFLNSLEFPIQIVIGTDKLNLDKYMSELDKRVEKTIDKTKNKEYEKLLESYKENLNNVIKGTQVVNRVFFIVIPRENGDRAKLVSERMKDMGLKNKILKGEELTQALARSFVDMTEEEDKSKYTLEPIDNIAHYSIAPRIIENHIEHIKVNKKYNRIIAASGYPRNVEAGFLDKIITANGDFDISIHIEPFPIESMLINLNRELQKQRADLYAQESKGIINPSLEIKFKDTKNMLENLQKGNEKLFNVSLYINCKANSLEELNLLCKKVEAELNSVMIIPKTPLFCMSQGLKSSIPICHNELNIKRNIPTSALSAFFPFTSQFLHVDMKGIWMGLNKNNIPIIKDIFSFSNPNGFILASSGAGKSYLAKLMISRHVLNGTKTIVIDPQSEYKELTRQFKGQLIGISRTSKTVINPLDLMGHDYAEKRLALMDLIQVMLGELSDIQKAVIDKALTETYAKKGITNDSQTWNRTPPIMLDLHRELESMSKQSTLIEKPTYRSLINRMSMYVDGVFSFLNQQTNINFDSHFVCFDVGDMPKQVKPVVMFLILEYVYMKMKKDKARKLLVIDEAWSLLARVEESNYIFEIVKTCRKFNLGMLLITQDVADLIKSNAGNALLANSAYHILMRQKPAVIEKVARTFRLSNGEKDKLLTSGVGEGILIAENDHSELKIIASKEEDRIITTSPEKVIEQNKENKPEPEEVRIKIDSNKGFFRKKDLKPEEMQYLLDKDYIISSHVPLGGGQRYDYLLKPRSNESAEHFFLVKELEEYLKQFTDKIELFETKKPDVIFKIKKKEYALEIETGVVMSKDPQKFFRKIQTLDKEYGKRWFFIVTKSEMAYKYAKYGKTYTRKDIERKIRAIFKERNRPNPAQEKSKKPQPKTSTKKHFIENKRKNLGGKSATYKTSKKMIRRTKK